MFGKISTLILAVLVLVAVALAVTGYRVDSYSIGPNGITSNRNASGVRAAYTALFNDMRAGRVAAACSRAVSYDQAACQAAVILAHRQTTEAEWAKLRAKIDQPQITVTGNQATWSDEGKREEAIYSSGNWLFTFISKEQAEAEAAPTAEARDKTAAESKGEAATAAQQEVIDVKACRKEATARLREREHERGETMSEHERESIEREIGETEAKVELTSTGWSYECTGGW